MHQGCILHLHQGLAFSEAVLPWKELRAGGLLYPQLVVITIWHSTNLPLWDEHTRQ